MRATQAAAAGFRPNLDDLSIETIIMDYSATYGEVGGIGSQLAADLGALTPPPDLATDLSRAVAGVEEAARILTEEAQPAAADGAPEQADASIEAARDELQTAQQRFTAALGEPCGPPVP